VQTYLPAGTASYFLDGLGNVIAYIPSSSIGNAILTEDQVAPMALSSAYALFSELSDTASVSVLSEFSNTASYALFATSASYAATSSVELALQVSTSFSSASISSSYADTASYANQTLSASYAPFNDNPNATSASWASSSISASYSTNAGNAYAINFILITAISASWVSASVKITTADTASYVQASNVSGKVSNATTADTASYVLAVNVSGKVSTATTADTASYVAADNVSGKVSTATTADTASYVAVANIDGTPVAATSASWVSASVTIITAQTASYIQAENISGTVASASYALTSSYISTTAVTSASWASSSISASYAANATSWGGIILITNPLTLYVDPSGSDSNNGLSGSSTSAFKTIQHAVNVATSFYSAQYSASMTIQLADGTYSENVTLTPVSWAVSSITIHGNTSSPQNVIVDGGSGNAFICGIAAGFWHLGALEVRGTYGIQVLNHGMLFLETGMRFGTCTVVHMSAEGGGFISFNGNYTIAATGGLRHFNADTGGMIISSNKTVTLIGTPAFSDCFAYASCNALVAISSFIWSGGATGKRYYATLNGVVYTNNATSSYFPGNSAGTTDKGGQYY
jgi:hypothetical protein